MLKNKIIVRKIRNIVILLMAIIIMIGAYKNIDRSRAEDVIEIGAIALDNYGYLENERFVLEAKQTEDNLFEIELPNEINGKKINKIVKISLGDFEEKTEQEPTGPLVEGPVEEESIQQESTSEPETEEPTTQEPTSELETEVPTTQEPTTQLEAEQPTQQEQVTEPVAEEIVVEETTTQEPATEPEKATATEEITETTATTEENATEQEIEVEDGIVVEGNKIYLTQEQIDNEEINIEVEYEIAIAQRNDQGEHEKMLLTETTEEERKQLEDAGIIKIENIAQTGATVTQEPQVLYNKILRYEDKENNKTVELKGYLPINAELQVEQVTQEKLTEIFKEQNSKIDVAYDIKILIKVVTQVPVDEANPTEQQQEIIETIEINPEDFGETCEVTITDANIETESKVYHVNKENKYEKVEVIDNSAEGNISFKAQNFSTYAITNEEITTYAESDEVTAVADTDTTKPQISYTYNEGDINYTDKIVKVVFTITDENFSSSSLAVTDITVTVDAETVDWTKATREFESVTNITNGKQYTLLLKNLQQSTIATGDKYADYSGYITITIPAGKASDTSGNTNDAISITIGENEEAEGTATEGYPYIPDGYTQVSGTNLSNGLVIDDGTGNQFVWVEVPRTAEVYKTAGLDITEFTAEENTKILNDLNTYTSTYRNWQYSDTYSSGKNFWLEYPYEYTKAKMLKSIYKNGGFYVGRYEMGYTNLDSDGLPTEVYSKQHTYPLTNMQYPFIAPTFPTRFQQEGYVASTMYDVQWNLIMKYLETSGAATQSELKTNSTAWGNYLNGSYAIKNWNAKYIDVGSGAQSWSNAWNYTKPSNSYVVLTTGASDAFKKQNIYDLAGNMAELTLGRHYSSAVSVHRGGVWGVDGSTGNASSYKGVTESDYQNNGPLGGIRAVLYKDEGVSKILEGTPTYIPEGYTHVQGTSLESGYVVEDENGNQFVWVDVPRTTEVYPNAGLNITDFTDEEYNLIESDLHLYTEAVRYGTTYTDNWPTDVVDWTQINESYISHNMRRKKMLKSIYKNGGFYVGRYEAGIESAPRTSASSTLQTPVIKKDVYPYNYVTPVQAHQLATSFSSEDYASSLLFGVQWDLIIMDLYKSGRAALDEFQADSEHWGNFKNTYYNTDTPYAKWSEDTGATWNTGYYIKSTQFSLLLGTGASSLFEKKGIYDIAGNMREATYEYTGDTSGSVSIRGGGVTNASASAAWRQEAAYNATSPDGGFRVALYKDEGTEADDFTDYVPDTPAIIDVVDPLWSLQNINIDKTNKKVTADLLVTDKYFKESTLTASDISVYVDGTDVTSLDKVNLTLGTGTELTEDRTVDGVTSTVQYGMKYPITIDNWVETSRQDGKQYLEWSGSTKISISAGKATDRSNNTSKAQDLTIGTVDFIKPEFTYKYSGTSRDESPSANPEIDYDAKKLTVVFSVTDKNFDSTKTAEQYLTVNDLTIKIDGEEPTWRTKGGATGVTKTLTGTAITETRTKADGTTETVTIGYEYTLVLSNLQQSTIESGDNYLNYSGIVTIEIPAGKFEDIADNTNDAQSITVGIDIPDEPESGGTESEGSGLPSTEYTTPYLPTGYTHVTGTDLSNGLTIQDSSGNQYVWVEVPTTLYENTSYNNNGNKKPTSSSDYDNIEYCLQQYTATYRNGTSYTDTWYSEVQHGFASEDEYNALKYKMLKSVYENGGFYVGKYETGIADTEPDVVDTNHEARTASGDTTQKPIIQANAYPYNYVTNKQAQELAESFATEGYETSLMFGVQWDLVLKHLETKNAATVDELNSDSTEWGNYKTNTTYSTNANAKYYISSWTDGAYNKTKNEEVLLSTGASTEFERGGIYDLAGNVYEWTLENTTEWNYPCVSRGGNFSLSGYLNPARLRASKANTVAASIDGFRVSLYRDEDLTGSENPEPENPDPEDPEPENPGGSDTPEIVDVVDPVWTVTNVGDGTYKLQAKDKYFASSELTEEDIEIYIDGELSTTSTVTIGTPTELKEDRDGDGTAESKYGEEYPISLNISGTSASGDYVQFTDINTGVQSKYKESQLIEIKIAGGTITDQSQNTSQEQTLALTASSDIVKPEVIYKYAETTVDPINNKVTVIFDITDKYYSSSTLEASHITAKIGDTTITDKSMTSANLTTSVDGTNKVVGKRFTLVLTPGEKTGIVTVNIPAGKVSDSSSNTNNAQVITVGIDLPEETGSAVVVDLINPTVSTSPEKTTNSSASDYVKSQSVTITVADDYSGLATNSYQYYLSASSTALSGGSWTNYTSGTAFTIGTGKSGTYYLLVKTVKDNSGNISTSGGTLTTIGGTTYHSFGPYKFDNTAPTISYNAFYSEDNSSYTSGTWTNKEVRTTISSTEAHSGIKAIQYSTDKTTWTTFSFSEGALTQSGNTWSGTEPWGLRNRDNYYYFKAIDNAGNESTVSNTYDWNIKYDISNPSVGSMTFKNADGTTYTPGASNWTNQNVNLTLINGTDPIVDGVSSGHKETTYTINGTASTATSITTEGTHTIVITTKDNAGNVSNTQSYTVNIDKTRPTISVNTTLCTWRKTPLSVTITTSDTGGSGLSSSNSYQYYLSNSATDLTTGDWTGDAWTNYTSGTAISLNPGKSGTYYLFVKRINDNAGNTSTSNGTDTAVSSTTYHRYGTYQFDYDTPTWSYVSKDIYYSTANDAGNDDYANKERTVKITFKGTDPTSKITSTLTKDNITVKVNGTAVTTGITKTLTTTSTADKEIVYTLTITGITGDGTLGVELPSGTLTDQASNTNSATNIVVSANITIDNTNPNLTLAVTSPTAGYYKAGQVITITATYNENVYKEVTSNTLIDTTAEAPAMTLKFGGTNAKNTVSCTARSGNVFTYTYTIKGPTTATGTDGDNGSMTISLGTVYDRAGNAISASNVTPSVSITADTIAPTVTSITANRTSPTNAESITYTVIFSETVTGFAESDVTVNSGKGSVTSVTGSGTTWSVVVSTTDDQEYTETITIKANGATIDRAGNKIPTAKTSDAMVVDRIDPTLTITADKTSPTNASSITYTFEFSENVTGFTADDITLTATQNKATKGTFTTVTTGRKYTLVVNTVDNVEETVTVSVAEGKCVDKANNGNVSASSTSIVVDRIDPTLTITADKTSPTNASSITYTFEFSENVTGFTTEDITLTATQNKATKGTFTTVTAGRKYTLVVNTVDDVEETVTVSVAAGKCVDKANNGNVAASSTAIVVDRIDPTLTITANKTSPTNASSITYTFTFSEPVTGFTTEDITLTATQNKATKGTFTATSSTVYTLVVNTVDNVEETVTVSVPAGKCVDKANNGNVSATSTAMVVDRIDPTLTITADKTSPTNASSITYTFEFSENVTGFTADDITLTATQNKATKGTFTTVTTGRKYTLVVNTVDNVEETVTVSVAEGKCVDKANNGNVSATSTSILVDRIDPTWSYVSKDIYLNTANDAGNDDYANVDRTVKITFKGTDANGHNVTSTLTSDNIVVTVVKADGTTVTTVANSNKSLTTTSNGTQEVTHTLTITGITGDGTLNVEIPSGTLTDPATNTNATANITTSVNITIDNTNPNLTLAVTSPTAGYYKAGQVITITATYNENVYKEVTSNTLIDTTAEAPAMTLKFGGATAKNTVSCTARSGNVFTYTYTIKGPTTATGTDGDNGSMTISLGTVYDAAGNSISATNVTPSVSITADTIAPTVTSITANRTSPTNAESITYTVTFSEAVTGFVASDVTVNSGKGSVTSVTGSGTTWSVVVSTTDNQEYTETITIKANGATIDRAGNKIPTAKTSDEILVDRIDPTLTITADKTSPTNASTITYTFEFSENVTGFTTEDITLTATQNQATKGTFTATSSTVYTLVVNTVDDVEETVTVSVAEGKCVDKANNGNVAASSTAIVVDRIDPTLTITADKTSPTNASSITYTFEFSENVTGFTTEDITLTATQNKATKGTFTTVTTGRKYTLVVNTVDNVEETVTVSVAEGKCVDKANNGNVAASSTAIVVDRIDPTLTITADKTSPTNASSITYTFEFSENVTGFTTEDITLTATQNKATKGTFTTVTTGRKYTLVVNTVDNVEETVTLSVAEGKCVDKANNGNVSASSTAILVDRIDPTWSYVSKDIYLNTANDVGNDNYANADRTVKIVFKGTDANSHNVTSTLTSDAIEVSINGTAVPNTNKTLETTGNGTQQVTHTLTITGITGDGTLNVELPSGTLTDQAINTNTVTNITTSVNITIDNTKPTVSFAVTSPAAGYYKAGQVITITVTYNDTNIGAGIFADKKSTTPITTENAPAMALSFGNTASKGTATCTNVNGRVLTYTYTIQGATPVTGTNGDNGLLKITSLGTVYDAAGNSIAQTSTVTPSPQITADTILPTVAITANRTSYTNSTNITYTFEFSENVTGFTAEDVTVANGTKGTFTAVSGTVYTLVVSTIDDTVYTESVSVSADKCIDIAGNGNIASNTLSINVDRKDPTITATPDKTTNATANDYQKSQSVTITVEDEGAGLLSSNSYQYFLSSSSIALSGGAWTGGTWTNYTSGTPFTIGEGLTGDYYLFVKTVKDNVVETTKNVSNTAGTMTTIDGTTYHMFGTYKFDNTNPYWIVGTPNINYSSKNVTVEIIGTDDHSGYKANTLDIGDIEVWVDGTKITNVTKALDTGTTVTQGIKYTLTLSDFAETARQSGKSFKEWSGSTKIVILDNSLEDNLANKNTSKDFSLGHIDLINPEFTYEYANTTIVRGDIETVTVIFDVTDKFFAGIDSTKLNASKITVSVDDYNVTELNNYLDTNNHKQLTKIKDVYYDKTAGTTYVNSGATGTGTKVGERYQLVISGLDQGDAFKYSGYMTLSFEGGAIKDTSNNTSVAQSITIGKNDVDGNPGQDTAGNGVIVDVVDPIWELGDVELDTGLIKLRTKDKYFSASTIDEDDITVYVNGVASSTVEKDITSITPTDIKETVNGVANTVVGKEYTLQLSNLVPSGGGYTEFTPTNLASDSLNNTAGFKYRSENGGYITLEIAAGVTTDTSENGNNVTTLDVGAIDVTLPEIYEVQKIQNASANTETIIFNVTDRNYDSSDLITKEEITLWIDNVLVDSLIDNATLTYKPIKLDIDGVTGKILGHQYTLVISNIAETTKRTGKDYLEWSGTLKITIDEDAAKDLKGNTLNTDTTTITDFVDYLKPQIEAGTHTINTSAKTYTMTFKVIDKYLYDSNVADIDMITTNEITVYVDGQEASSITKNISSSPITATMNKTVNGAVTSGNYTIGHTYTLVLGGFEQNAKQDGKSFMEWSGTVKIVIAQNATKDTTNNTFDEDVTKRTVNGEHVDFIKPVLEEVSSTRGTNNETIVFNVMDKYLANTDTNVVAPSEITVYVDGEAVTVDYTNSSSTGLNGVLTKVQNFTSTVNGDSSHIVGQQYQLVLSGFEQASRNAKNYKDYSGTVSIELTQNAVADTKGNTLDSAVAKRTVTGDFVDFIKPELQYTHSSSNINTGTKTYTMTFDMTDKYYNDEDTNNVLTLDDLTITMQSGQLDSNGDVKVYNLRTLANEGKINIGFNKSAQTATFKKTVGGVVETTATSHVIGHTYTLTISNLDQLEIQGNDSTVNYSGIINVVVAQNQVADKGPSGDGTNTNKNVETSITSGVNIPGGTGSGTVVDVVSPVFDKISSSAYAFNPTNTASSIATITFKATDTYFVEGSGITADDIQVVVNGTVVSSGITKTITATTELEEDRIVNGVEQNDVQYGVQYTLEITGWAQNANQVKIRIPAEKLTDQNGNKNIVTDMILYNCLELTNTEVDATSGFLGNSSIDREDVQNVTFLSTTSGAPVDGEGKINIDNNNCWDASAQSDKSIIAWRTSTVPYTVYIGSYDEIFANQNSSYLFSCIGSGTTTAVETITNLNKLNTSSVTNMIAMFANCGSTAMTELHLGDTFDTSNVTLMTNMFSNTGKTNMTTMTLGSNFNTAKVTNMSGMFEMCGNAKLAGLNLGEKFYTSEVTDMSNMFNGCGTTALTTFSLGSNFNTIKVENMSGMFQDFAYNLATLNLGGSFNTSAVEYMNNMFKGCGQTSMTTLTLGDNFNTSAVQNMSGMFQDFAKNSTTMTSLDLKEKFYTTAVTDMTNMFNGCGKTAMIVLDLGPAFTKIATSNTDFMKDCGKSTLIIYAPESIYLDRTSFKLHKLDT